MNTGFCHSVLLVIYAGMGSLPSTMVNVGSENAAVKRMSCHSFKLSQLHLHLHSFLSLRFVKANKKTFVMITVALLLGALLIPLLTTLPTQNQGSSVNGAAPVNNTIYGNHLRTWWHPEGEMNSQTAVLPGNVRQSHMYSIQVSSSPGCLDGPYYDSFVYASIPRNGQWNGDSSDGVTIEADVNITMAWTQFLYTTDVWLKVHRLDGTRCNKEDIVIRPTRLDYPISDAHGDVFIRVPYSDQGSRFSVEFQDNLYTYRDNSSGLGGHLVQNEDPSGSAYVQKFSSENPIMGVEPRDALLVFASPFLEPDLVPDRNAETSLVVKPGLVTGLHTTSATAVIFQPGVYYFGPKAYVNLSSSVNQVFIAGGAYVKGAIEFSTNASQWYATGHGVLSGEQYQYQTNPSQGYNDSASNGDCLRMWSGLSYPTHWQIFILKGITINAPPYSTMDFTGDLSSLSVQASDYKQVGSWYAQTDGLENYAGSYVHDVFYHSNDDTIKAYYSNTSIERVVIWKGTTAPAIQFGWASRNLTNVTVDTVDVIHSRYNANISHPSLIGANQIYPLPENQTNTAQLQNNLANVTFSNLRSEGVSGNLLRIVPLQNYWNFRIENVSIDWFPVRSNGMFESEFPVWTDVEGDPVSIEGFVIKNFFVNGTKVDTQANNWQAGKLGGLNFATSLWTNGSVAII